MTRRTHAIKSRDRVGLFRRARTRSGGRVLVAGSQLFLVVLLDDLLGAHRHGCKHRVTYVSARGPRAVADVWFRGLCLPPHGSELAICFAILWVRGFAGEAPSETS